MTEGFIPPQRLRELNKIPDANFETFRKGVESADPAISANVIIGGCCIDELRVGPVTLQNIPAK